MHFLNVGKWDITWVLSLNCLWLVLPAICPNSATVVICLVECGALVQICITDPFHRIYLTPFPLTSTSQHRALINHMTHWIVRFVVWELSPPDTLREACSKMASGLVLRGYTPIRQQSLGQATEQELGWPFYKCLKCQLLLLPKRIFSLNSE